MIPKTLPANKNIASRNKFVSMMIKQEFQTAISEIEYQLQFLRITSKNTGKKGSQNKAVI